MSLKPRKKSDLDKSWMKKRRDKPIKIQPEYHLIVTERLPNAKLFCTASPLSNLRSGASFCAPGSLSKRGAM